jgi:hypothetical protein
MPVYSLVQAECIQHGRKSLAMLALTSFASIIPAELHLRKVKPICLAARLLHSEALIRDLLHSRTALAHFGGTTFDSQRLDLRAAAHLTGGF